jgi:hypothetical protein
MYKISLFFILISIQCVGQNDATNRNYVGPNMTDSSPRGYVITGLPYAYRLADILWEDAGVHWLYDKSAKAFKTDSAFINRLQTKYYSLFLGLDKYEAVKYLSAPIYPMPRDTLARRHGKVFSQIRYPFICSDCGFNKDEKVFYDLYYNRKGEVVRHGLAYLKKGKSRK